ncbi:FKBP-type peptidyl-prolyl cis-trans isomerase [Leucobacter sp. wl10]|uniref:FKBP-type peptidyl-prolyl cis-trans isomerase n=1 Tax=Leucobacter sp. wl10 TaxID=2304677 RepID=UPI000E5C3E87|nr:FKBP-type peptidyl-prolyl cis-trans isomerase [Leucobacter sp. wl10]RGE21042.1 FKBP-type peptidyl-prolyl cis-trans isomerase [Leucobacter sp. wl10]
MKLSRVLLPVALAGALLMTACSAGGAPAQDSAGADCLPAGKASDSVEVKGNVGSGLKLTSKTPVSAKKYERSVLKPGKGGTAKDGQAVSVAMTMFSGSDGSVVQELPESSVPFSKNGLTGWAYEGLRCATTGEQAAVIAPYAEVFGKAKPEQTGVPGITEKDSIVIVMEFGKITDAKDAPAQPGTLKPDQLLKKAEGTAKKAPSGFPAVELAKDGSPTITMPKGAEAPKDLSIATLIQGNGDKVQPGDRVYVNYRGVIWRTGEEFDSSWSRGQPAPFVTNEVVPGFTKALEGQKVGSQIIAILPPAEGYGPNTAAQLKRGNPNLDVTNDDTLVFVFDILGTVPAGSQQAQ